MTLQCPGVGGRGRSPLISVRKSVSDASEFFQGAVRQEGCEPVAVANSSVARIELRWESQGCIWTGWDSAVKP